MFHHPAQGLQVGIGPQLLEESIQVLRFKGQLHVVGLGVNLRPGESRQPVEVLLKGEPAGKGEIPAVVLVELQAEKVLIKGPGSATERTVVNAFIGYLLLCVFPILQGSRGNGNLNFREELRLLDGVPVVDLIELKGGSRQGQAMGGGVGQDLLDPGAVLLVAALVEIG